MGLARGADDGVWFEELDRAFVGFVAGGGEAEGRGGALIT